MVPQESGDCAKVKVKVRVNVHGVFSVSNASLIELVKPAEGEEPMETEQTVKEEEVCIVFLFCFFDGVTGKNIVCVTQKNAQLYSFFLYVLIFTSENPVLEG